MNDRKILVVDDSPSQTLRLKSILEGKGFSVVTAKDSLDAMNYLDGENTLPDLMLGDIIMPNMDGTELCAKIKKTYKNVPVIVFTAHDGGENLQKAFNAGAVDFLRIPFSDEELLLRINNVLRMQNMIEEQVKAKQVIDESEKQYAALIRTIPDIIYKVDARGIFTFVSEAVNQLGYSPDELIGKHFQEFIHPDDFETVDRCSVLEDYTGKITGDEGSPKLFNERRTAERATRDLELRLAVKLQDGGLKEYRYFKIDFSAGLWNKSVKEENKKYLGSVGIARDASRQKQTENDLANKTESLKERIKELNCLYEISKLTEKEGITLQEICQRIVDIIPSAWQYPEITCAKLTIDNEEYISTNFFESRWKLESNITVNHKKCGKLQVFYVEQKPEVDEGPFIKEERDLLNAISEHFGKIIVHIRTEKKLQISEKRFKDISYSTGGWLWEVDEKGVYRYCSENVLQVLGYRYDEMLCKTPFDFMSREEAGKIGSLFADIIRQKKPIVDLENWNITKDGKAICFLSNGIPIFDNKGNLIGYRGVDKDITELKKNEEQIKLLSAAVSTSLNAIAINDLDGKFNYVNPAFERMFGYAYKELSKMTIPQLIPVDSIEKLTNEIMPAIEKGIGWIGEFRGLKKNGIDFPISMTAVLVKDIFGKPIATIGTFLDITESNKEKKALQESEERYRSVVQYMHDALIIDDIEGNVIFANDRFLNLFGFSREELHLLKLDDYIAPEYLPLLREYHHARIRGKKVPTQFEYQGLRRDKQRLWLEVNVAAITDQQGRVINTQSTIRDISQRKQAEEELKKSLDYIENIFKSVLDMLIVITLDATINTVNPAVYNILGYKKDELIGRPISDIFEEGKKEEGKNFCCIGLEELIKTGSIKNCEHNYLSKSGEKVPVNCSVFVMKNAKGENIGIVIVAQDMRMIKKMEKIINDREVTLRNMYDSKLMGFLLWDADSEIIDSNDTFLKMLGYSKEEFFSEAKFWQDIVPAEYVQRDIKILSELAAEKDVLPFEEEYICKDGHRISALVGATVLPDPGIGGAAFVLDITERKKLKEQLRQSEKMDAVGQLSGGIAHDFNNILAVILANTEASLKNISKGKSQVRDSLKEILSASLHAKNVVKQLLLFARKTEIKKMPLKINVAVRDALKLIKTSIPSTITLKTYIAGNTGFVYADPTQISQLMINICTNAVHAMEEKGGIIKISLVDVTLDEESAFQYSGLKPGKYVHLTVTDTGHGINSEDKQQLFEPYFTTKPIDKGTGLGLAVTHGIVKDLGGDIFVESLPGQGASFNILFPYTEKKLVYQKKKEIIKKVKPLKDFKILLIDDEEAVLKSLQLILQIRGFEIEGSTNPQEALELLRANPKHFNLIITDMTMPVMTGDKLAIEALKIRHDIPIVLCTGFNEKIDEEKVKSIGITKYIEKPFTEEEIFQVIKEALEKN